MPAHHETPRSTPLLEQKLSPLPMTSDRWSAIARRLQLPPRQISIVESILRGMKDKQIAATMGLRKSTLRTYLGRVFTRLGVEDRMELVLKIFAMSQDGDDRL
jgi:DNA-binding NarL/FixJ family response regulator